MRVRSPVLVGRDVELAGLRAAFDRALQGHLVAVLVTGEAGIGKTRLVGELLRDPAFAEVDAMALVGGCLDLGGAGLPFAPYLEALRRLRTALAEEGRSDLLAPTATALVPLLPSGAPDRGGPAEPSVSPEARRAALFGAVLDTLAALCAVRPMALVIDDLHWADRGSLELTAFLGHTLRDAGLLLIMTMRDDEAAPDPGRDALLDDLDREGSLTRIHLERLSAQDTRRQLDAITSEPVREPVARSIHARSGGNPFLVEELLALADDGRGPSIPPVARDISLARLAAVPAGTRRLVEAVAVGGASVRSDHLALVLDGEVATLRELAAPAVRDAILVLDRAGAEEDRWTFRHALTREAVEADLLAIERRAWHARWAVVLTADPSTAGDTLPLVARHLDLAGDPVAALPAYLATAADARRRGAFDEAAEADRRAIELIDSDPSLATPDERHVLLSDAAETLRLVGLADEAAARIDALLALLPEDATTQRAVALGRSATIRTELGQHERAIELAQAAVDLVPDDPTIERARVLIALGIALNHSVRVEAVPALMGRALDIALEHHDLPAQSLALCQRGLAHAYRGDLEAARMDFERSWELAARSGDLNAILLIALDRPILADHAADYAESIRLAEEGLELVERHGGSGTFDHLAILANLAVFASVTGAWDRSEEILQRMERLDALGRLRHEGVLLRARLSAYRGLAAEAERQLATRFVPGGPQIDCYDGIVGAEVAMAAGEPATAIQRVQAALERAAPPDTRAGLVQRLEAVAIGIGAAGDLVRAIPPDRRAAVRRTAAALVDAADRSYDAFGASADQVEIGLWRAEIRAGMARVDGDTDGDAHAWTQLAEQWAAVGVPHRAAWAHYRAASSLLARRADRADAEGSLRSARAIAERLGMEPLLREVDGLARRARLDVDPTAPPRSVFAPATRTAAGLDLTPRERQVLALMVAGRTNREIGEGLFISPKTAGVHVGNILAKLGSTGRVEAVTIALREGLLDGEVSPAAGGDTA